MTVRLHVDTVVLEGLPISGGSTGEFEEALREALLLLLQGSGAERLRLRGTAGRLTTAAIRIDTHSTPAYLGTQVAEAIHGALSSPGGPSGARGFPLRGRTR